MSRSKTFVCKSNQSAVDFINALLANSLEWVYIWNGGPDVRLTVDEHRMARVDEIAVPFLIKGHKMDWEEIDR